MSYYRRFTKKDAEDFNLPPDDPVIGKLVYVHEKKDKLNSELLEKALNKLFELREEENEN